MSVESPGEDKTIAVLSGELFDLQISNNNTMSMSLCVPTTTEFTGGGGGNDNDDVENGIELLSMPPMATEAFSENESESSSVGVGLKRMGLFTPQNKPISEKTRAIRSSAAIKRAMSLPRTTQQPTKHLTPLKQTNKTNTPSYRESVFPVTPAVTAAQRPQARSTPRPQKPNSLPSVQSRAWKPGGAVNGNTVAAAMPTKHKVINTTTQPQMDRHAFRIRSSLLSVELKSTMSTSTAGNQSPYGTMPRRRKQKSIDNLQDNRSMETRSQSVSRDTRMTASIGPATRKQLQLSCSGVSSNNSSTWTTPTQPYPMNHWPNFNNKQLDMSRSQKSQQSQQQRQQQQQQNLMKTQRTRIFYEQSVQTCLNGHDLDKLMAGENIETKPPVTVGDSSDRETQCSDIRDIELERLREENRTLCSQLQREREEKLIMQRELQLNTERVMGMLELARVSSINGSAGGWTPTSEDDASSCSVSGHDSLLMLESQIQMSGHELVERQQEIRQLRKLCRSLQAEMERSVAAQQFLLQEKAAIEEESNEMQDFLQHEKAAMFDALREIEADFERCKDELNMREEEVKTLREKCRYLVRSNEQRRQENLLLQTKYSIFKNKSKGQIAHEHATISAAYNALSKLHLRLKSLVDELKLTYNITEQDLELQTAQLESHAADSEPGALKMSTEHISHHQNNLTELSLPDKNGSIDDDGDNDDGALSPERHKSFIAAIIGAIRSAATPHKRSLQNSSTDCRLEYPSNGNSNGNGNGNDAHHVNDGEMLDLETEPCLMMDNVLQDVELPDTYSNNLVSNSANATTATEDMELINVLNNEIVVLNDSLSFHNLSQAIVNRKNLEQHHNTNEAAAIIVDEMQDSCLMSIKALIEKVNDVDTLVTRLLRLIQIDNDNCIQQLIVDKNKLQQHKEEMLDKIRELQQVNIKLQDDLMDATQELMLKNSERNGKKELQSHHSEIDFHINKNTTTAAKSKNDIHKINEKSQVQKTLNYTPPPTNLGNNADEEQTSVENEIFECDVIEVMDLISKLQAKTETDVTTIKPLRIQDVEGNVQSNLTDELPSANQLEDILNTFDTVDNLDDIDAEVQQTIMKLRENWSNLCLSNDDYVDSNANAN